MHLRFGSLSALGLLLALSISPMQALNPNYNFAVVAANGQSIDGLTLLSVQSPQIDNFGRIVFFGGFQAGSTTGSALFTPNSVLVKYGDTIDGHLLGGINSFAMDPTTGRLAFIASESSGAFLVFSKDAWSRPKLLAATGDRIDGLTVQQIFSVAVNAYGFVAFAASYIDRHGNSGTGIFSPDHVLAKVGQVVDHNFLASIDTGFVGLSLENVYFRATTGTGTIGIFTTDRVVAKTGDTVGGNQITSIDYPAINAFGSLVFAALTTTGAGLFNPPRVLFTQSFPDDTFPAAINNFDVVAYGGPEGVTLNNTPLIGPGDAIGSDVLNGFAFPVSLNDRDQVAFQGNIAGAANALILATPKWQR
jgi:hypothetical protein